MKNKQEKPEKQGPNFETVYPFKEYKSEEELIEKIKEIIIRSSNVEDIVLTMLISQQIASCSYTRNEREIFINFNNGPRINFEL